ncbi:MAG TPA: flavoprotein [Candidatus Dormibacteraeota bacterium]|nr:flavoprotein [Candidatus Dormibacteraeota bacterium]
MPELQGRRVLVGVGGSVAAYKACDVVTELRKSSADVRVAMSEAATRLVSPLLLRSLSGHRVAVSMFDDAEAEHGMPHIDLGLWCEVHAVVAASADLIARLALGLAGDVITASALSSRAPLLIAPAMETMMWEHPATQANVATLASRGVVFVGPVSGRLASGREGAGRMAEPADIVAAIATSLG